MKVFNIVILVIGICFNLNAQGISESELIGSWAVTKVTGGDDPGLTPEQKQYFEVYKKALSSSTFTFKADKQFEFDISISAVRDIAKNSHWTFSKETGKIVIRDSAKRVVMDFTAVKRNGVLFFLMEEDFIQLEMKKKSE